MAIDYGKTARELVAEIGGDENIKNVTHCATRLRFILREEAIVDDSRVKRIPGVITTVRAGGQFQVVIGNHVRDAYEEVLKLVTVEEGTGSEGGDGRRVGFFSRIIDVISSIFVPFLYTLAACGILQGILGVLVALGWIDTAGGTYQILNFVSWTAFTFLPVLIAVTASKKFGVNTFIAIVIACALVSPDYINMVNAGADVQFLGLRVQLLSYTSSVIPIILAVWVASYVQRFFDRYLPVVIRNLFSPMFTIAIMVPLTLLAFGPVGNAVGGAIGGIYNFFYGLSPIIAGVIVGGLWEVLVIFGVHWGITPVTVGNYANLGYDTFTGLQASAVFSQAGAALGVFLKTKDKDMKGVSLSAAITGLFGITEPAIYGVNLRLKKPMICGCVAGALGGAIAGGFRAVSWSYNMPGIATLPAYFRAGHMTQFVGLVISIAVSFLAAVVLTYVVGFEEDAMREDTGRRNDAGGRAGAGMEGGDRTENGAGAGSRDGTGNGVGTGKEDIGGNGDRTGVGNEAGSEVHGPKGERERRTQSAEGGGSIETAHTSEENGPEEHPEIPPEDYRLFSSPVSGEVIPLAEVKDAAFSSGMLGIGVGILPEDGKVFAPFDGTAAAVFPTGHAVGLRAVDGVEALIHIGIDTVRLEGKGFQANVKQGEAVRKGELLVVFDLEYLRQEGYDSTVIYLLTNQEENAEMKAATGEHVDALDPVMGIAEQSVRK